VRLFGVQVDPFRVSWVQIPPPPSELSLELFYLKKEVKEEYKDVAKRVAPDVLVEDDCESIGGEEEMTYPHISPEIQKRIRLIKIKEFGGIDHLVKNINILRGVE
jgi:hypothetical protein